MTYTAMYLPKILVCNYIKLHVLQEESWFMKLCPETLIKNQVWIRLNTNFSKVELGGLWILLGELKLMSETIMSQSGSLRPLH